MAVKGDEHTMPWAAKYRGRCTNCQELFEVGHMIQYGEDSGLIVCADYCEPVREEITPEEARAKMCQSCFLVHAGECY